MENGRGLRLLAPDGRVLEGRAAGGKLMAGRRRAQIPLLLPGLFARIHGDRLGHDQELCRRLQLRPADGDCTSPKGYTNIRGAMLYASFVSGAGYLPEARDLADRNLFLGGMAADNHVAFYPNSAVLADMDRWPAVFFAKGLWDRAESLEGTVAAYDRVTA